MHRPLDPRNEEDYIDAQDHQPYDEDFETRWSIHQDAYLKKYPHLTDEDLEYNQLGYKAMIKRIAERTGRTQQEVESDIRSWMFDE